MLRSANCVIQICSRKIDLKTYENYYETKQRGEKNWKYLNVAKVSQVCSLNSLSDKTRFSQIITLQIRDKRNRIKQG